MTTPRSTTLASTFEKIFDRPIPLAKGNQLEILEIRLRYSEQILNDLKQIKECLLCCQIVSKADTFKLMKTIRKLYTYLEVWGEIESVWVTIRKGLNEGNVTFTGQDLYKKLLINKNIVILNRELFQVGENLIRLRKMARH